MVTPDTSLSHRQHLVSTVVRGDPQIADALFELMALTDASEPEGASAREDVLQELYCMSTECLDACRLKEERLKAGYQARTYHGLRIESDA